jgi:hypothetical protein
VAASKPDLSSVDLKLARASEHMDVARDRQRQFLDQDPPPFGFRVEETAEPDRSVKYVLRATVRTPPPRELGLVVGDAVQNIRQALDHLVYELAPPSRRDRGRTGFPIFDDRSRFEAYAGPLIEGLGADERTLIERHQPYHYGVHANKHPLAILNRLANQDKHRVLLPIVAAVRETDTWIGHTNAKISVDWFVPGPVVDGARIIEFSVQPEDTGLEMHVQPQSGLQIQLAETTAAGALDASIDDMLKNLHGYVRNFVVDAWFKWGHMIPEPDPPPT